MFIESVFPLRHPETVASKSSNVGAVMICCQAYLALRMGVMNVVLAAIHQISYHEYKINILNMQVISLQCIIIIIIIILIFLYMM